MILPLAPMPRGALVGKRRLWLIVRDVNTRRCEGGVEGAEYESTLSRKKYRTARAGDLSVGVLL
jgi:hypothetical protein